MVCQSKTLVLVLPRFQYKNHVQVDKNQLMPKMVVEIDERRLGGSLWRVSLRVKGGR